VAAESDEFFSIFLSPTVYSFFSPSPLFSTTRVVPMRRSEPLFTTRGLAIRSRRGDRSSWALSFLSVFGLVYSFFLAARPYSFVAGWECRIRSLFETSFSFGYEAGRGLEEPSIASAGLLRSLPAGGQAGGFF